MTTPYNEKQERIDLCYDAILTKKEYPVNRMKETIRQKWALGNRAIEEYIQILGTKPKIKVVDGIFKLKE